MTDLDETLATRLPNDQIDQQIQALADAARLVREWTQLALAQRALNVLSLAPPHTPAPYREAVAHARTLSVADARAACLRLIAAQSR